MTSQFRAQADLPVLIVDDDQAFLSFVRKVLSRHGRRCELAATGRQGLAMLRAVRFQSVLLDLRLPDQDGIAVLREIVKDPDHPPVYLISGAGSVSAAWQAGHFGAAGYLEKPLTIPALLDALEALSGSRFEVANPTEHKYHEPVGYATSGAAVARLASALVRASAEPSDFRHGRGLARAANIGYGTMRHWCHLVGISGRGFVRFARGFWATRQALLVGCAPWELLECVEIGATARIVDPRLPCGTTIEAYCRSQMHFPVSHPLVKVCMALSL